MAYSVTKCDVGGSTASGYHYEYLCESADDIADLPTGASSTEISRPAPGSLAYIESDSSARYILKISREWGEFPMAGGGGSTGGGVFVVNVTMQEGTEIGVLDKTVGEIVAAVQDDKAVLMADKSFWDTDQSVSEALLGSVNYNGDAYEVVFGLDMTFTAATLDDYPTISG